MFIYIAFEWVAAFYLPYVSLLFMSRKKELRGLERRHSNQLICFAVLPLPTHCTRAKNGSDVVGVVLGNASDEDDCDP